MQTRDSSLSLATLAVVLASQSSGASGAEPDGPGITEIVVTAQKIEQNVIDVPISMSVLDTQELEAMRVQGVEDFVMSVPNVNYFKNQRSTGPQISIRGVSGATGGSFSPVGVTVDGMPYNMTNPSVLLSMRSYDLEQVEVLRGPQGTLTGANALGGILNLVTAKPDTSRLFVRGTAEVGNLDSTYMQGVLNTPLSEEFALRTVAYRETSEGATKNIGPAGGSSSTDNFGVRVAARWLPTENLTIDASYTREEQRYGINDHAYSTLFDDGTYETSGHRAFVEDLFAFYGGGYLNQRTPLWNGGTADNNGSYVSMDYPEGDDFEYDQGSIHVQYDMGAHHLDVLYGNIRSEQYSTWDADRTEFAFFATSVRTGLRTDTAELRVTSNYDGRFNWVAGLAWLDENIPYEEAAYTTQRYLMSPTVGDTALDPSEVVGDPDLYNRYDYASISHTSLTTRAVFANVFFDITERLHLSAGIRFTDIDARAANYCDCMSRGADLMGRTHDDLVSGLSAPALPAGGTEEFNPRIALNYDVTDRSSAYFQFATGFRPGVGNVPRIVEAGIAEAVAAPELVKNYELGYKGRFFSNRLNFALAVFYMDYTDLQLSQWAPVPSLTNPDLEEWFQYHANAGKASIEGFELETQWQVTNGLQLRGAVGYADSRAKEFGGETFSPGLPIPMVRPWNAAVSGIYETPLMNGLMASFRADYRWQDDTWESLRKEERMPGNLMEGFATLDLSAAIRNDNWSLTAYMENALDEKYYTGQINWSYRQTIYYIPRKVGLRLTYDFRG